MLLEIDITFIFWSFAYSDGNQSILLRDALR